MKKLLLLSFALFASFNFSLAQTIYTADNNPGAIGGTNVFLGPTALTDAIAAASGGDIIHVVRSSNDYGATTIDRPLSIFGIGLNPDTDGNNRSIVSTISITDPIASGTRLSGLWINTILNLGGTAGTLSNLLIENSNIFRIHQVSGSTLISNVIIRNNMFGNGNTLTEEAISLVSGSVSLIVIANNVIIGASTASHGHGAVAASNGTSIENNLFIGSSSTVRYAFEGLSGCSVKNNIFYGLQPHGGVSGSTFENNISYNTGSAGTDVFSTASGNTSVGNKESMNPQLVNVPYSATINITTFDPSLVPGSPAENAGEDGTDMGVYGGPAPMKLSGTLIPLIQSLTLPSMILKGNDLPVQIKAEGN